MVVYIILFLMVSVPMFLSADDDRSRNWILLFEIIAAALLCGLADMMGGYDRYIYGEIFDDTAIDIRKGMPWNQATVFLNNPTEIGWCVYNVLLGYITPNRYIFILIHTLIVYAMYAWHLKRLSPYPLASFFVLFCIFYFFTWTYLRQTLGCGIAWFAIPFAVKRKPIPFFAIVALAATFHNSALLFAVIYFVANIELSRNTLIALFILSVIIGMTPIGSWLFAEIGPQISDERAARSLESVNQTPRLDYIVEGLVFIAIFYFRYDDISKDGYSLCLLNIGIVFMLVITFFARFTDGGRMGWYFMIGVACTLGQVIARTESNDWVKYTTILIFTVLFFRIVIGWGIQVRPYKTFLTNGVRENDIIWEVFEYDHNYDNDKFYNLRGK